MVLYTIRPQCTVAIDYRVSLNIYVDMQNVLKIESVNLGLQHVFVVYRAFNYSFSTYTVKKG